MLCLQLGTTKSPDQIEELISDFMIKIIEPMINIYALRLIHDNHEHDIMLLASATNSVIVEPIAKDLAFKILFRGRDF